MMDDTVLHSLFVGALMLTRASVCHSCLRCYSAGGIAELSCQGPGSILHSDLLGLGDLPQKGNGIHNRFDIEVVSEPVEDGDQSIVDKTSSNGHYVQGG